MDLKRLLGRISEILLQEPHIAYYYLFLKGFSGGSPNVTANAELIVLHPITNRCMQNST